jgi:hypothetical protein
MGLCGSSERPKFEPFDTSSINLDKDCRIAMGKPTEELDLEKLGALYEF